MSKKEKDVSVILYCIIADHGRPVLKTNPPSNYINAVYTYVSIFFINFLVYFTITSKINCFKNCENS